MERMEFVSKISHAYLETHAPKLFPYIKKEYDEVEKANSLDVKFDICHLMDASYYAFGFFDSSAIISYQLLEIANETKNNEHLYFAYSSISSNEEQLGSLENSLELLFIAHNYAKFDNSLYIKSHIEIGWMYLDLEDFEKAKHHLDEAIAIAKENNDYVQLTYAYTFSLSYHFETGQYNEALKYFAKVDSLVKEKHFLSVSRDLLSANITAGEIYMTKNDIQKARIHLEKAFIIAKEANDLHAQAEIHHLYSKLEEDKNNFKNSLHHYKRYADISDSIYGKEARVQMNFLKSVYELDIKDNEIKHYQEIQLNEQKQKKYIYTIAIISVLTLLFFALYLISQLKSLKIKQELSKERELAHQLRIEQLSSEIELKNKELADIFLHQYEKAKLLQDVIDNVDASNEKIKKSLASQINKNSDWENFKIHFDKVHEGFFDKLLSFSKDFTTKDIRFCAYIRMNLTTKEIAIMLGISHRTVQGIRGRVRKKLNLTPDQDLTLFLMNL